MSAEMFFKAAGIKALVVDDNEVNTMVVSSMLEQFEIQVTEVYSGKDAIEREKYEDFDIIFMDYLMPEMNGIEATEEIRKLGKVKRPVIIALSANETQELKSKFEQAGVDDVMSKPLELEAVCQIIKKWIPEEEVQRIDLDKELNNQNQMIFDIFSKVEGLDVKKGLSHLANSAENYIKVIEAAVDNIHSERKRLTMYSASQVQASSMKISFHSLKGVFLNLGASRLSEQSQLFELACSNPQVDLVADNLEQYLEDLKTFTKGLEEGLLQYGDDYTKNRAERYIPISSEEYEQCIEDLKYYLSRYEFNFLSELTQKLIYASKGERRSCLEDVYKKIQNFKYEEALQSLEGMEEE